MRRTPREWLTLVLAVSAGAVACRTGYLFVRFALHMGFVHRFHVEASTILFLGLSLAARALTPSVPTRDPSPPIGSERGLIVAGIGIALCLYWPALWVGLLSDDFVLASRATSGQIGAVSAGLFRPMPLLLWFIMLRLGGGAVVLHAVNVVLHGVNSFLVYRISFGWTRDRGSALCAGILFLSTPLGVEPVTWCSGIFDVSTTFFCLCAMLTARTASLTHGRRALLEVFALAICAVLCKETAVVLPALLAIDVGLRRAPSKRAAWVILILGGLSVVYAWLRLFLAFGDAHPPVSKYVVQKAVFNTFSALAVPLPVSVAPLWVLTTGLLTICLVAKVLLVDRDTPLSSLIWFGTWCLACVVPVYPIVFVSEHLEGSRYLYEAMVGWAVLVAVAALNGRQLRGLLGGVAVCILIVSNINGLRLQLDAWREAASQRDSVVRALRSNPQMLRCRVVGVYDVPDSVSGAYVLRNGLTELVRDSGLSLGNPLPACDFAWSASHNEFIPSPRR